MSRETAWRSMYSDISNLNNSIPSVYASCRATSVFPTPVGPLNKNAPTGFLGLPRPLRDIFIAEESASIALS